MRRTRRAAKSTPACSGTDREILRCGRDGTASLPRMRPAPRAANRASQIAPLLDPRVHALLQDRHGQVAFFEDGVVESPQVEARPERTFGLRAQLEDRELAELVGERLAGPHHVA